MDVCFVQLMCPRRKFIGPTTSDRGEEIYNWDGTTGGPVMARRVFSCGRKMTNYYGSNDIVILR